MQDFQSYVFQTYVGCATFPQRTWEELETHEAFPTQRPNSHLQGLDTFTSRPVMDFLACNRRDTTSVVVSQELTTL